MGSIGGRAVLSINLALSAGHLLLYSAAARPFTDFVPPARSPDTGIDVLRVVREPLVPSRLAKVTYTVIIIRPGIGNQTLERRNGGTRRRTVDIGRRRSVE